MPNPNHPRKGQRIRVDPVRRTEDIQAIKQLLSNRPRDLLLFTLGVNNGLRAGDLLKLRVKDVRHLKIGDTLQITENKTKKSNTLIVNKTSYKALRNFLEKENPDDNDYLFASKRKHKGQPLTVQAVNALVKQWCRAINLPGNYGSHSLRKTHGYILRSQYGVGFEIIAECLNHANPASTMAYLGITKEEVTRARMNEI